MLEKAITHDKYEKISDDLLILSNNIILKFTVGLYNNSGKHGRTSYHNEYEYYSQKSSSNVISIRRTFDYFLSLENIGGSYQSRQFIRIGIGDVYSIQFAISKAIEWFTSKEHETLFAKKENRILMTKKIQPIVLDRLPMGKYIKLEPVVSTNINTDEDYIALRMYLSAEDNYGDISLSRLMGLKYLLDNINMYQSALLLLNYLQRPPLGQNIVCFDSKADEYRDQPNDGYIEKGRKTYSNQSYFDKMKKLED